MERFDKNDFEKYKDKRLTGRLVSYNKHGGFGFIRTENNKDIILLSFDVPIREDRMSLGMLVSFKPEERNEKYYAAELEIIDKFPNGQYFEYEDIKINVYNISKIFILENDLFFKEIAVDKKLFPKNICPMAVRLSGKKNHKVKAFDYCVVENDCPESKTHETLYVKDVKDFYNKLTEFLYKI